MGTAVTDREAVIRRVAALLRHAESAAGQAQTTAEATTYAAKAQQLQDAWEITQQELIDAGKIEEEPFIDYEVNIGNRANWRRLLMCAIAEANFAECLWTSRNTYRHLSDQYKAEKLGYNESFTVFGQKSNIQICEYLYEYLAPTLERLADAALKQAQAQAILAGRKPVHGKAFRNKFLMGAVSTLRYRLNQHDYTARQTPTRALSDDVAQTAGQDAGQGAGQDVSQDAPYVDGDKYRALVLVKGEKVKKAYKEKHPKVKPNRTMYNSVNNLRGEKLDAYIEGQKAGRKVSILRGAKGRDELPLLEGASA